MTNILRIFTVKNLIFEYQRQDVIFKNKKAKQNIKGGTLLRHRNDDYSGNTI